MNVGRALVVAFLLSIVAGVLSAAVWVAMLHVTAQPPPIPR